MKHRSEIVLVGPMRVGKSSTATILSERLNKPIINLDNLRGEFAEQTKIDVVFYRKLLDEGKLCRYYEESRAFELKLVNFVLNEHSNCIFDFGGGNASYESEEHIFCLQEMLAPFHNSFLLLPSNDLIDSMMTLNRRSMDRPPKFLPLSEEQLNFNNKILTFHYAHSVAKHIILNEHTSIEETANTIEEKLTIN